MVGAGVFSLPRRFAQETGVAGALIAWAVAIVGGNVSGLIPQGVLAGLHASRLDGANLKQLLADAVAMPISDVEQHVSFVKFDATACKAMGVKPGTRGLLLESAAAAGRGNPVYFLESYIPPNDRRLEVSALR